MITSSTSYTGQIKWPFVIDLFIKEKDDEVSSIVIKTRIPTAGYKEFHLYPSYLIDEAKTYIKDSSEEISFIQTLSDFYNESKVSKASEVKTIIEACRAIMNRDTFKRKIFVPTFGLRPREDD